MDLVKEKINSIKEDIQKENSKLITLYGRISKMDEKLHEQFMNNGLDKFDKLVNNDDFNHFGDNTYTKKRKMMDYYMDWMDKNNSPTTISKTFDYSINTVENLLKMFHFDVRDCELDDVVWKKHDRKTLFNVQKDTIVFANTIREKNVKDNNTITFMDKLVDVIGRFISDDSELQWNLKSDEDRETNWVFIVLRRKA